ncbi:MmgE/PrpD family protein [Ramlibacter sp. G-1-2-2]|uniref:MmgE/PrpD family protein n=1 Tax=Ramlibacter agri TaxID=2728837 RepID=A0A848H5M8_9BURK|nr:MmgE/PrpD family protein [Ramlibacter agri]NML44821.1 MmgE/PrpD family protein [Ramlibacter agri]
MNPDSGLTASLGAFAARPQDFPAAALQVAAAGVCDAIGTMFAGRKDAAFATLRKVLLPEGLAASSGEASVLLGPVRTRALDAAFLNGVATHALAMDDVAAGCHPSALLVPALLAEAETLGRSGRDLLQAYVVGYEVLAELASREPDALHGAGWHPSCMLGPPAVAAAVARLRGLDAQQCTAAIAAAASMTGGLVANFGTQTKAIQVARASSAGLLAARLAAEGLTASSDALERDPGLLKAISPQRRARLDGVFDPGELRIVTQGLSIKKYPVCYSTHRVVDAAADVARQPGFSAEGVQGVQVDIGSMQAWMARHHEVRTPFEAKYSVEFAAASGLVARDASFAQLSDDFIHAPLVQRLIAATTLRLHEEKSADDPVFSPWDRVVVTMKDGRVFDSGEVAYALGHARRPLDAQARRRKFLQCAEAGGFENGEVLLNKLENLQDLPDVRQLST